METITIFNFITGIGIIGILVFILAVWAMIFLQETNHAFFRFIKKYSMHIAWGIVFGAMVGSLIYSEFFKIPPCLLCWWQRMMVYPQVVILGVGIWFRDTRAWITSITLASVGSIISIIHILIQSGRIGNLSACDAFSVSCDKIDVLVFGWITIPIMCLVVFAGVLTCAYVGRK